MRTGSSGSRELEGGTATGEEPRRGWCWRSVVSLLPATPRSGPDRTNARVSGTRRFILSFFSLYVWGLEGSNFIFFFFLLWYQALKKTLDVTALPSANRESSRRHAYLARLLSIYPPLCVFHFCLYVRGDMGTVNMTRDFRELERTLLAV
jgi:hypothetical protein